MEKNLQQVLDQVPLFAPLDADFRIELGRLLETRHYAANQVVVWIGDQGTDFFIIQKGAILVTCPDESGKEVTLGELTTGQFFGEISLLDGGPRTANARARDDVTVLALARGPFLDFLRAHPDAAIHMLTILGQRQRDTNEKLRGIRNVNDAIEAKRTATQRASERIANIGANELFVVGNLLFFVVWIIVNSLLWYYGHKVDEPPTFFTLGFIISLEAILLSMFVLNSQKRQAERDRVRADLDYQVNVKAHQEVLQLHQKVDRMQERLIRDEQRLER